MRHEVIVNVIAATQYGHDAGPRSGPSLGPSSESNWITLRHIGTILKPQNRLLSMRDITRHHLHHPSVSIGTLETSSFFDNASSCWIGPNNSSNMDGQRGGTRYETTFSLTGFNPSTASGGRELVSATMMG